MQLSKIENIGFVFFLIVLMSIMCGCKKLPKESFEIYRGRLNKSYYMYYYSINQHSKYIVFIVNSPEKTKLTIQDAVDLNSKYRILSVDTGKVVSMPIYNYVDDICIYEKIKYPLSSGRAFVLSFDGNIKQFKINDDDFIKLMKEALKNIDKVDGPEFIDFFKKNGIETPFSE